MERKQFPKFTHKQQDFLSALFAAAFDRIFRRKQRIPYQIEIEIMDVVLGLIDELPIDEDEDINESDTFNS